MTLLGKILAALNVLAALAFATLLVMAYGKRQAWSFAVFRHDVQLLGLPIEKLPDVTLADRSVADYSRTFTSVYSAPVLLDQAVEEPDP